jgi:hypothetical protein
MQFISSFGALRRVFIALMALGLSVLAACGGGGGGGGDGSSGAAGPVPVSISVQPSATSSLTGTSAAFSVTAAGDGLSYQWQRSTDAGTSWADIAGASAATYTIASVDTPLTGSQYRVVVKGTVGSVTSSAATLTVTAVTSAPTITTQPAAQTVVAGGNASFSVTAAGTALTYQWQSSPDGIAWTNVSGATGATLSLSAIPLADSGKRWRVVVSNSGGSVNSNAALLTVNASGGGGGGGGGTVSTGCVPPGFALPTGTTVQTVSSLSTSPTPFTGDYTVVGPSSFNGNAATEIDISASFPPLISRVFGSFDAAAGTLTGFGAITRVSVPGGSVVQDSTSTATPPAVDARYRLTPGQSLTQSSTSVISTVLTTGGVAAPPTTETKTLTSTVTFVGTEVLTTPAGTFNTCKYVETNAGATNSSTTWVMVGYGVDVKAIPPSPGPTSTLTSITVNGAPLTRFP